MGLAMFQQDALDNQKIHANYIQKKSVGTYF